MGSVRIIFAGSGAFGLPALRAIIDAGREVVQVVTQPDRPAGRGRKLSPTPIGEFAENLNLPLIRTDNINNLSLPAADVMVVIAFGQKISQSLANAPRIGSINLHASLLPKYRGAAPINWAILNGETETGNSVIRLAEKMDAGKILCQSKRSIGAMETAGELHDHLAMDGAPLILRAIDELVTGRADEQRQIESLATMAPKLSRQNTILDFTKPADQLARQIRGLYPWPGCRVRMVENDIEIARFTLVRAEWSESLPLTGGQIAKNGAIACAIGSLRIIEIQPPGKNAMTLTAYQNGHRWPAGAKIESAI